MSRTLRRALTELLGEDRTLFDADALRAYECDGFTIHKAPPEAVVLPRDTQEVQAVLRVLAEHEVAFVPRGAGTCLSGGPTPQGPAVVIETAGMNRILAVHAEDLCAVVQPGVVNAALSRHVEPLGLHYAPDPSSQTVCTIGGNLAENSGGPHCFKYGMTTDHMLGAVVVLAEGRVVRLGGTAAPCAPGALDLLALFTGSEGTFGIATEITVRLCRNPECVRTLLVALPSMQAACRVVSDIIRAGAIPAALEILDRPTILAVEASVFRAGYPTDADAVLLVEMDGPADEVDADAELVRSIAARHAPLSLEEATTAAERKRLWKGRKGAFGAMGRLRPDLYVLDGVVPRTKLEETLRGIAEIGARHRVAISNVFHAGDGNLHPNISYDGRDREETARVVAAGHEILALCMAMGGSITGEHGIGSEKLAHVPMMFDPADLEVMARVRRAFDPSGRCNPGKVLPERGSCAEPARWPRLAERVLREDLA
ncbi:MAG: FAD-linked oxidase C-terminal domain-containing protein [Planctomycetota bacterium]